MYRRKRRRRLSAPPWRTIAVLVASLLVPTLFFLSIATSTVTVPAVGGSYVEGAVGSPIHINPLLAQFNEVDKDLAALVFSGLTRIDERGEPLPDLAETWQVSPDGLTYIFHLRQGVTWHDGAPFTAEDVLFTVRTIQDPDFPGSPDLAELWRIVKAAKLDDYTVRFTLEEPYAPFLTQTALGILPAHILTGVPVKDLPDHPFNLNPVGTGPFRVQESSVQSVVLTANPNFYRGAPYLSKIVFLFSPNYQELVQNLLEQQVDGALLRSPNRRDLDILRQDERLRVYSAQRFAYELVFLNLKSPLFREKAVRQALAYGLDRRKIVENEAEGQGLRADSPILPGTWAYEPEIKRYQHDPGKAKALLEAAGWKPGPDGIRQKNGTRLEFYIFTENNRRRIRIAEEISRELEAIGVKAKVASSGASGLIQNFLIPRRFEAALLGLVLGPDPDPYSTWHSPQGEEQSFNFASLEDPRIDSLLEQARKVTDLKERAKLYSEFQKAFAEEVPSLLLYYPTYYYLLPKEIKGVRLGNLFEGSDRFRNVTEWYIKTKRVEAKGTILERFADRFQELVGR
jgi:peptide/nickel transport system substrate-binding protein